VSKTEIEKRRPETGGVVQRRAPWLYREQLRDILDRKQINVVSAILEQWCTNVLAHSPAPPAQCCRVPS
jgi:hypothetical protein